MVILVLLKLQEILGSNKEGDMKKVLLFLIVVVFVGLYSLGFAQKDPIVRDARQDEWGITATSPVTGVSFKVRKDTKVVEYRGKVFYFDAKKDLDMFLANPRKYAGPFVVKRVIANNEIGKFVISPISGKIFIISPNVISAEYDGKIFYFLSEAEYQSFEQNPDVYPFVTVDLVVNTNIIVKTNYIVTYTIITNYNTNIQLVNEIDIKTNYIIKTNQQPAVQVFQPQVVGQPDKVVVVSQEPKDKVVIVQNQTQRDEKVVILPGKPEKVTTITIEFGEEKKLIKFQRKKGNDTIIVREPHQKELGKIAISPVNKEEFIISTTSYVVRFKKNLYYLKDEKELNTFLDNFDRYAR